MRVLIIAVMAAFMAGCASNVVTDYNSATVFGNFTSWAYAPGQQDSGFTSLDDSRVRAAIEREMTRKAMKRVPDTEADLLVTWQIVPEEDRKSTRLNSSHVRISYAVFCLKK